MQAFEWYQVFITCYYLKLFSDEKQNKDKSSKTKQVGRPSLLLVKAFDDFLLLASCFLLLAFDDFLQEIVGLYYVVATALRYSHYVVAVIIIVLFTSILVHGRTDRQTDRVRYLDRYYTITHLSLTYHSLITHSLTYHSLIYHVSITHARSLKTGSFGV